VSTHRHTTVLVAESTQTRSSVGGAIRCAAQSVATVLDTEPSSFGFGGAAWMHAHPSCISPMLETDSVGARFGGAAWMDAHSLYPTTVLVAGALVRVAEPALCHCVGGRSWHRAVLVHTRASHTAPTWLLGWCKRKLSTSFDPFLLRASSPSPEGPFPRTAPLADSRCHQDRSPSMYKQRSYFCSCSPTSMRSSQAARKGLAWRQPSCWCNHLTACVLSQSLASTVTVP
jgi:hypothetical protein